MSTEQRTCATEELFWFKSSHSGTNGGDCVEVATAPGTVHVRDSRRADGPSIRVSARAWSGFVADIAGHGA